MEYYLAPWEWKDDGGLAWYPPGIEEAIAILDLRSLPQQSLFGGVPEGWGFFAYANPQTISNSFYLGNLISKILTNAQKNGLKNRLNLPSNITSDTLVNILFELFTVHADPTGQTRWKPLMPNLKNNLELVLNGHSVVASKRLIPESSPEWLNVKAVLQEDYRKIGEGGKAGLHNEDLHRRFLQSLVEQYDVHPNLFIPDDLPKETPLPHNTIITESFNTTDSTTLGPDLSWTELEGDMDIFSNTCRYASALNFGHITSRADTDLATADQYSQIVFVNALNGQNSAQGCHRRKNSSATLTYYHSQISDEPADRRRSWKRIAGTFTLLTNTNGSAAVNDVLRGEIEGSTYRFYLNSILQHSGTDTAITGNLRCGVGMHSDNLANTRPRIDNFEAGDLATIFPPFKKRESTLIRM